MSTLLGDTWYYEPPIDFEHKQYVLFAYLKLVDEAFYKSIFSPYLLHTEKLVEEMKISSENIKNFEKKITAQKFINSWEGLYLMKQPPKIHELSIVIDIIDFSIPLLSFRVELGKDLFRRSPKLLY